MARHETKLPSKTTPKQPEIRGEHVRGYLSVGVFLLRPYYFNPCFWVGVPVCDWAPATEGRDRTTRNGLGLHRLTTSNGCLRGLSFKPISIQVWYIFYLDLVDFDCKCIYIYPRFFRSWPFQVCYSWPEIKGWKRDLHLGDHFGSRMEEAGHTWMLWEWKSRWFDHPRLRTRWFFIRDQTLTKDRWRTPTTILERVI